MKILTASISNTPALTDLQISKGFIIIDITIKSACKNGWLFIPTWNLVNDYATGKDKFFMVWSDYFPEEQSCRVYFSKNINGEIELITEMEKLLKSINSGREVVACDIEDNIL